MSNAGPSHQISVYVSSTVLDLADARRAAIDAVWRSDLYPLTLESDEAQRLDAGAYSLSMVDRSDVYIGILGWRYGFILPGYQMSIPELEYRRARQRGIPILIFMPADDYPIPDDAIDPDPANLARLQSFKAEVLNSHTVGLFSNANDLAIQVYRSLLSLREAYLPAPPSIAEIAREQALPTSTSVIFISYRRDDAVATCLHLAYRLEQHFGPNAIYMDEGSIPPGADWHEHIKEAIAQCGVALVIIGQRWLEITDEHGQRRLDDPNDVLREEIESALRRRIPVIPVLVDATRPPRPYELPESLRPLFDRQGLHLRNSRADFGNDVLHIIQSIEHWITPFSSTA